MELNSNDQFDDELNGELKEEEPEEDHVENLEMEEPNAEQGVEDVELTMSKDDTSSSPDSSEEPEDDFDSDYDPLWDHQDDLTSIFLGRLLFKAPSIQYSWVGWLHFVSVVALYILR